MVLLIFVICFLFETIVECVYSAEVHIFAKREELPMLISFTFFKGCILLLKRICIGYKGQITLQEESVKTNNRLLLSD